MDRALAREQQPYEMPADESSCTGYEVRSQGLPCTLGRREAARLQRKT
jgi:hypothetical protein